MKKSTTLWLAAGLLSASVAQAEISASADLASSYLFRGVSESKGEAVVSGSLDYGHSSGLYAGIWGSSGDTEQGGEYDIYAGFSRQMAGLTYDIGYLSYIYPADSSQDGLGDTHELYWGMSGEKVGFTHNTGVGAGAKHDYYTLSYSDGSAEMGTGYSVLLGYLDDGVDGDKSYTHLDLSYSFNENISFTASKIVDAEGASTDDEKAPEFVVSYSLPIK